MKQGAPVRETGLPARRAYFALATAENIAASEVS
jgi:hypothetical protein